MRKIVILIPVYFILHGLYSQVVVRPVSGNPSPTGNQGIYYALPQTCFKIDIEFRHTRIIPGPYASYAGKYLGLEDVNRYSSSLYEIINVQLDVFSRPDPARYYFVEYGDKTVKEDINFLVSLTQAGMIVGFNEPEDAKNVNRVVLENETEPRVSDDLFKYLASENMYEKIDTTTRKITIDTLTIEKHFFKSTWTEKPTEQKAKDAADFISRIRENSFLLISGYQEVDYGESIRFMYQKLLELENQYLSLFTGITLTESFTKSFIFIPEQKMKGSQQILFNFSSSTGFDGNASSNDIVYIRFNNPGLVEEVQAFVDKKNNLVNKEDVFYYRIPEYANVEIIHDGEVFYKSNMLINQFGLVVAGPLNNSKVRFHPESGSIKSIEMKIKQ